MGTHDGSGASYRHSRDCRSCAHAPAVRQRRTSRRSHLPDVESSANRPSVPPVADRSGEGVPTGRCGFRDGGAGAARPARGPGARRRRPGRAQSSSRSPCGTRPRLREPRPRREVAGSPLPILLTPGQVPTPAARPAPAKARRSMRVPAGRGPWATLRESLQPGEPASVRSCGVWTPSAARLEPGLQMQGSLSPEAPRPQPVQAGDRRPGRR